jgi:AcrR family transcriptional regulator
LAAARTAFGTHGYDATSLRGVARAAGVDPALVHRFYGGKPALFAAAMDLPAEPGVLVGALLEAGLDGIGDRIIRTFLAVWDSPADRLRMTALLSTGASSEASAELLRGFLTEAILTPLAAATDRDDGPLRASLAASQLVGLALARYVLKIEPLASTDAQTVAAALGPTLQRYLTA